MARTVRNQAPLLTKEIDRLIAELSDFRAELRSSAIPDIDYHNLKEICNEEIRIVQLTCQGLTSEEVGKILGKEPRVIEYAKRRVMNKVGARNMVQSVFILCKAGILK